ncbi:MAG: SPOR domain-containing protein [Nitrospirota bacterium]
MKDADFKDRASLYILGKEFIIVIVVIFSALSFTLGYFVGKGSNDKKNEPVSQMMEITPSPQKQEQIYAQPSKPEETNQDYVQTAEDGRLYNKAEQQKNEMTHDAKPSEKTRGSSRESRPTGSAVSGQKEHEIIYTVQLGAFKNASDAENFKAKYDKKGYATYITVSKNSTNEKIYKIRTGEFRERKDAEILSLKLKKNEGLNSFVTFKNE